MRHGSYIRRDILGSLEPSSLRISRCHGGRLFSWRLLRSSSSVSTTPQRELHRCLQVGGPPLRVPGRYYLPHPRGSRRYTKELGPNMMRYTSSQQNTNDKLFLTTNDRSNNTQQSISIAITMSLITYRIWTLWVLPLPNPFQAAPRNECLKQLEVPAVSGLPVLYDQLLSRSQDDAQEGHMKGVKF